MLLLYVGQRIARLFCFLKFILDSDEHNLFFILFWTANIASFFLNMDL